MRNPNKPNAKTPQLSRRSAIGKGAAVAGAIMLPGAAIASNQSRRARPLVGGNLACQLPEEHWANLVDHKFIVNGLTHDTTQTRFGRTELELLETSKVESSSADQHRPRTFKPSATSLVFRGPAHFKMPSATYRMHHPWLGDFDLMLSPTEIQKYAGQNIYNAILNN